MLDGRHDPTSDVVRTALLTTADGFEWLFVEEDPYEGLAEVEPPAPPEPPESPESPSSPERPEPPEPVAPSEVAPSADPLEWPLAGMHPAVATVPAEAEASIEALGGWLKSEFPDARERVRVMHDWVADHVAYDFASLGDGTYVSKQSSAQVFASRRAVCAGYSNLMVALGQVTGDEITYVGGYSRDRDGSIKGTGHAWNAVQIDGDWHLMDVTWDAGSRGDDGGFRKDYGTAYLFTPPAVFLATHLPDDPRWQLVDPPVSRGDFTRMPMMSADFYAQGLAFESEVRSQVTVDGQLQLALTNPKRRSVTAVAQPRDGGREERCQVRGSTSPQVTVTCGFSRRGAYEVVLFTHDRAYGTHSSVGTILANTTRGSR